MIEVAYNDIRTGQWIKVVHEYRENGPTQPYTREWVGKVSEVSQKWLKLTHKKQTQIVPQTSWAEEKIFVLDSKERKEYA